MKTFFYNIISKIIFQVIESEQFKEKFMYFVVTHYSSEIKSIAQHEVDRIIDAKELVTTDSFATNFDFYYRDYSVADEDYVDHEVETLNSKLEKLMGEVEDMEAVTIHDVNKAIEEYADNENLASTRYVDDEVRDAISTLEDELKDNLNESVDSFKQEVEAMLQGADVDELNDLQNKYNEATKILEQSHDAVKLMSKLVIDATSKVDSIKEDFEAFVKAQSIVEKESEQIKEMKNKLIQIGNVLSGLKVEE